MEETNDFSRVFKKKKAKIVVPNIHYYATLSVKE